jgi:probable DNA repair protein
MKFFKPRDLFERLRSGHVLITGNRRLARVLVNRYAQWRAEAGEAQWPSPRVLSWNAWTNVLWEEAALQGHISAAGAVPGRQQLLSLWEQVLQEDPAAGGLLRPESLAAPLAETRELLIEWQVDFDHRSWRTAAGNENCAAFRRWNRAFESLCQKHGWTAPENRIPLLTRAVRETAYRPKGPLDLVGFDELSPARQELLDAVSESGTQICLAELEPVSERAVLWKSVDRREELERMARWVRQKHETNPSARIAVVVPDLDARQQEIRRQLKSTLVPDQQGGPWPWNLSMGIPLARVPVIEGAFDLLRLTAKRVDIQHVARVLHSPWTLGSRSERGSRALLEKHLRDEYPRQFDLKELRYRAGEICKKDRDGNELPEADRAPQPWHSPEMKRIADRLLQFFHDNRPRTPSAWAESIEKLLGSTGWPHGEGGNEPGDHDHDWQAFQAWQDTLRDLASLDSTTGVLAFGEAVSRLGRICRENVFQQKTPPASIQVLGLYEAIGLRFDHLWVLGLHSDNWPPPARGNPFIPAELQLAVGLPHSGPQRELEVARTVTRRLLETAPDCVFSYPGQVDGEDTLPSPLLMAAGITSTETVSGWAGTHWLDTVHHGDGPVTEPLAGPLAMHGETARGGTSILRNQAACPFRAFAINRLGAEGLATPADGITATLHGSLVHEVLEGFWRETVYFDALLALDKNSLEQRLQSHVDAVLQERRDMRFRPAFSGVEAGRLLQLALDYLEIEKQRSPFEVSGFEQAIEYEIEGQSIRLVIDRIDRLPSGETVIIDYKTGTVKPDRWFGDPPEEPQLPLYAMSAAGEPAAVVYAVVREDGCLYKGIVRHEGLFPGLPRTGSRYAELHEAGRRLPETTANWREVLHRLMAEFLAGRAEIQPVRGRTSCNNVYCELQPLCRIDELEQLQERREGTA